MAIYDNRKCKTCGAVFSGGPRAWYCPECRIERKKITTKEHRERKTFGKSRKIGERYKCERCGEEYVLASSLQKYCEKCTKIAHRELDNRQGTEYYHTKLDKKHRSETRKKYYALNKEKINEKRRLKYRQKKEEEKTMKRLTKTQINEKCNAIATNGGTPYALLHISGELRTTPQDIFALFDGDTDPAVMGIFENADEAAAAVRAEGAARCDEMHYIITTYYIEGYFAAAMVDDFGDGEDWDYKFDDIVAYTPIKTAD